MVSTEVHIIGEAEKLIIFIKNFIDKVSEFRKHIQKNFWGADGKMASFRPNFDPMRTNVGSNWTASWFEKGKSHFSASDLTIFPSVQQKFF